LPGVFAISSFYLFAPYFEAMGRPGIVTIVLVSGLAVKLVLCVLLIPIFGAAGAAISSTAAYSICFILFIFLARSKFKMKEIFTLKEHFTVIKDLFNNIFDF
jgi:Na+-driven multidrug efflux pump